MIWILTSHVDFTLKHWNRASENKNFCTFFLFFYHQILNTVSSALLFELCIFWPLFVWCIWVCFLYLLCVSRDPEERQLRPPSTSEEWGGGSERQTAEFSLLWPVAPAHQLPAHTDYGMLSWVMRNTCKTNTETEACALIEKNHLNGPALKSWSEPHYLTVGFKFSVIFQMTIF